MASNYSYPRFRPSEGKQKKGVAFLSGSRPSHCPGRGLIGGYPEEKFAGLTVEAGGYTVITYAHGNVLGRPLNFHYSLKP